MSSSSNWFLWGSTAAIGTAIWNITLLNSPKDILKDPHAKSAYLRIIIVIAGIISLISLFLPTVGASQKITKLISKDASMGYMIWSALCLAVYQVLLIYAFSAGGTLAQAMVNLNIILMVIFGAMFMGQKTDLLLWIMLIIYAVLGMGINYYNSTILK